VFTARYGLYQLIFSLQKFNLLPVLSLPPPQFSQHTSVRYEFLNYTFYGSIALCGAETWMLRAVDRKQLESFEMWCCRRMERISWTDHVRNEELLLRVKEQRNILREISKRKAN
jgi:hypothetical protein